MTGPSIDPYDCPITLLPDESAGIMAARRPLGYGFIESVGRSAVGNILDLELRQRIGLCGAILQAQSYIARFRLRHEVGIGAAVASHDTAHRAPAFAIIGKIDRVARGKGTGQPMQDQATEFA